MHLFATFNQVCYSNSYSTTDIICFKKRYDFFFFFCKRKSKNNNLTCLGCTRDFPVWFQLWLICSYSKGPHQKLRVRLTSKTKKMPYFAYKIFALINEIYWITLHFCTFIWYSFLFFAVPYVIIIAPTVNNSYQLMYRLVMELFGFSAKDCQRSRSTGQN